MLIIATTSHLFRSHRSLQHHKRRRLTCLLRPVRLIEAITVCIKMNPHQKNKIDVKVSFPFVSYLSSIYVYSSLGWITHHPMPKPRSRRYGKSTQVIPSRSEGSPYVDAHAPDLLSLLKTSTITCPNKYTASSSRKHLRPLLTEMLT